MDTEEISSKQAHFDIISGIHGLTEESNIQYLTRHIKGYQDDISEADLDRWALLNIECDLRAKQFMSDIITGYRKPPYTMKKGIWQVKVRGIIIGTKLTNFMRESISGDDLLDYYVNINKGLQKTRYTI